MIISRLKKGVGTVVAAVVLAGALPMTASASLLSGDPLISANSEIAFFGNHTPVGSSDLAGATGLDFPDPVIIPAGTGDFAAAAGGVATFSSFDFVTPTLGTILTFADGGSFTATSVNVHLQTATALDMTLSGIWSLNGRNDTAGTLVLTADSLGGLNTFSAVGAIVPVPGALLLFGSALIGLGAARRKS